MASVAQLNVRIGGDIRELNRALSAAERSVRAAGNRLSSWGNELSLKLSLPILGIGAAALKTAGDMEALNKSMVATFAGGGRSAAAAQEEVNALRKAAEAPGLDFEQAVKASIRLQGVGLQAEAAHRTIVQLANAIATTGGTADNLNSVTVQFSQMISKGKIMAGDLRIVQENMPVISQLMEQTFGTSNSERLQQMGISGKEFVEKITTAMEKLPRVEGGISNAIVNAGTAIKMFLASVGESLNKTFNITAKLENFGKWLDDLSQSFSKMSEGQQRVIAGIAVFAVALGPMLKVGQGVVLIYGQAVQVFGALRKVLLQSLAGEAIPGLIGAWKALDAATKLTIIGAAIGVALALASAFVLLAKDTDAAALAQTKINQIMRTAQESVSAEKVATGQLVDVLRDNNATLAQKQDALKKLNDISPTYFAGLKAEAIDITALNKGYDGYIESLLRAARVKAGEEQLIALDKQRIALAERKARLLDESIAATDKYNNMGLGQSSSTAAQAKATQQQLLDGIEKENAALTLQENKIKGFVKTNIDFNQSKEKVVDTTKKAIDTTTKEKKSVDELAESYSKLDKEARKQSRTDFIADFKKTRAMGAAPEITPGGTLPTSVSSSEAAAKLSPLKMDTGTNKLLDTISAMREMDSVMRNLRVGIAEFSDAWTQAANVIQLTGGIIQQAAFAATSAAQDYAEKGGASFRDMGKAALAGGAKVVRSYIMQGVASAVSRALQSVPFPFNIIAGGLAGALAGTLFNKLLGALQIPAMANGGISGGGMTLVGERGPELVNMPRGAQVIPNHKLSGMMGGAAQQEIRIYGELHGDMIRLANQRATQNYNRINGV